jgi:uncharacterized membrane protein YczE
MNLLYLLLFGYICYGIMHIVRNRNLKKFEKLIWIILVICMPVIGTSIYFRSNFVEHHGKW